MNFLTTLICFETKILSELSFGRFLELLVLSQDAFFYFQLQTVLLLPFSTKFIKF